MASLVDAVIAVPPLPFIAIIALPITRICPCTADIAEHTGLQSPIRIIFASQRARRCSALGKRNLWLSKLVAPEDVRVLMGRRVSAGWSLFLVEGPGSPAKAVPVLAAFLSTVAGSAEVVGAIVAAGAVVV
jgi:hypothetical protein